MRFHFHLQDQGMDFADVAFVEQGPNHTSGRLVY